MGAYTCTVTKTKVFEIGNSQAVRIPQEFQFDVDEVEILRQGKEIVLRRVPATLGEALASITPFSDDFMEDYLKNGGNQGEFEKREELL